MNMRQAGCKLLKWDASEKSKKQFNELENRKDSYSTVRVIDNMSRAVGERDSYLQGEGCGTRDQCRCM